ncbi:UbiX family flavin prenyltransferase [Natrinema versiforme]|uniref:Flavin prenyltransferase UbiX n=1 Tax=Natrinema versiforme TaxID=88724 RepID=A0A4P8WLU3_9EURY|nr:UbiX family flavin prenyltransferase [Natrinema versiforme]QCS44539.1 UbiX family flavin prenyltransferase [Natrinema versiforme]
MKLIIGITGASGIQYGAALVRLLEQTDVESHLIISKNARYVMSIETDLQPSTIEERADVVHNPNDIGACIASGSFNFDGMIVCPCSMKTLGYMANGIGEGLIPRAADVCLKEGRDLLVVFRESPLSHTHVENMGKLSQAGAIVAPAAPGFYTDPESIDELIDEFAAKMLDRIGVEADELTRWEGH